MAEIWGAAIAAGGAILGGVAQSKKAKEDKKDAKLATRDEAMYAGIMSKFEADQNYYFDRLNKKNTERGLDQFRAYNTIGNPNENRIVVPDRPDINTYLPEIIKKGGDKKKRSLFDKITDPAGLLGGDAGKIADPLGLFGG
jgi:hypothetical protein